MKFVMSLLFALLLFWNLGLNFVTVPDLKEQIKTLSSGNFTDEVLAEELKKKTDQLNLALNKLAKLEAPKESSGNQPKIEELRAQKANALVNFQKQIEEIDGFIAKGEELKRQKLNEKSNFKEGKIRTSDADRQRWQEERQKELDYYNAELEKLRIKKEELKRQWASYEAQIDLQILQLNK